jgi:hypothetical protein
MDTVNALIGASFRLNCAEARNVEIGFSRAADHATEMQDEINKPIFIVSAGGSGSTILTWCLGQHPNILPQEGSDWLGPFAIDAANY